MELNYALDRDDYVAYYAYFLEKRGLSWPRGLKGTAIICLAALALLATVVLGLGLVPRLPPLNQSPAWVVPDWVLVTSGVVILICILPLSALTQDMTHRMRGGKVRDMAWRLVERYVKAGSIRLDLQIRVSTTPERLTEVTVAHRTRDGIDYSVQIELKIEWHLVTEIVQTQEHAFIQIGNTVYSIIPRRIFPDEEAFCEAIDTMKRFWRNFSANIPPQASATLEEGIKAPNWITVDTRKNIR